MAAFIMLVESVAGVDGGKGDVELGPDVPDGSLGPLDGEQLHTVGVLNPQLRDLLVGQPDMLPLTLGSPCAFGRAGIAPAKHHKCRLAPRRRYPEHPLSEQLV